MTSNLNTAAKPMPEQGREDSPAQATIPAALPENGGPKGPEPTRFGDWERRGKCVDF
jgi:hypothetical protein